MTSALLYAHEHQLRFLEELKAFLRMQSISAQPARRSDIEATAVWLRDQLSAAGFPRTEVMATAGSPVVYAEWMAAGPDAPTVLVYGHYDVQPPDPVAEWLSPPFEPTVRGDNLYARGASDDKGQLYVHVKAAEAYRAAVGAPPVNLKFIVEGEEEIGSPSLDPFIKGHRELLAADVALISDSHILSPSQPSIVYALRGLAYLQIEVRGPAFDLHSGIYGGAVNNPLNALCRMLAGLQDAEGRVLIPGFYDRVRPLDASEREELARVPFDPEAWLEEAGVPTDWGDPDYTVVERTTARPTLDINGIWGGYMEVGAKTVLPSKGYAKLSMRLVPDQDPAEIASLVREHLQRIAPPSVSVLVHDLHGGSGAIVDRNSPALRAAAQAYAEAFGAAPVFVREGGSIPVVATFQQVLGIETVLMGFGLPDDRLHSPNEKLHLPNLFRGIDTAIRFFDLLAKAGQA